MGMQTYQFNYDQYKKKINPKKNKGFILIFFTIIALVITCIFIMPKSTNVTSLYIVEIDKFSTYTKANILAQEIQNSGGAGYVHFDGNYRVFASLYTNEKNAKNVVENLINGYNSTSIYTVNIPKKINTKNLTDRQRKAVENYANFCLKSIDEIANLIISYDKNETDKQVLKNTLATYLSSSKTYIEEVTICLDNPGLNISKDYANKIHNCFGHMRNFENSSLLKFQLINLAIQYANFVSSF